MIDAWLRREDNVIEKSGDPTWKSLCVALREIDQNGIAADIEINRKVKGIATYDYMFAQLN